MYCPLPLLLVATVSALLARAQGSPSGVQSTFDQMIANARENKGAATATASIDPRRSTRGNTAILLFVEPRAKGSRNVTLELTRELISACPSVITVTSNAAASEFRIAPASGASTLYRADGTVAQIFSARWTVSGLAKEICSFLQSPRPVSPVGSARLAPTTEDLISHESDRTESAEARPPSFEIPVPKADTAIAKRNLSQDCPVVVIKVTSTDGGFTHAVIDGLTKSPLQREVERIQNGGKDPHYLDVRLRNTSDRAVRAIEAFSVYANLMGDEASQQSLLSQNDKPIKPGAEFREYAVDSAALQANGKGDVTVYVNRVRFEDGTFWRDNGSRSCALKSNIRR
ncbi:MAG: hypothetical protein EBY17_19685 [Acidobacteriia bacterium]|nr:hypothetical protein [Terriglobia bacterium]